VIGTLKGIGKFKCSCELMLHLWGVMKINLWTSPCMLAYLISFTSSTANDSLVKWFVSLLSLQFIDRFVVELALNGLVC
jgi:hypothetical protein